jgi:hypothetical protein
MEKNKPGILAKIYAGLFIGSFVIFVGIIVIFLILYALGLT